MAAKGTARRRQETAAQIAARGVSEIFAGIAQKPDTLFQGSVFCADLARVFEETQKAVERQEAATFGPPADGPDDAAYVEAVARETGYLVGLHVGLHLRRGGA